MKFPPSAAPDPIATYRPDIDGLRAVAVLGVVAFHAAPTLLPGGYVGVDVFFVISGFLITGILIRDCEARRFSLTRFYSRRIRRILPALVTVLLTFTVVACVVLPPADLDFYSRTLVSATLFVANQFFLNHTGYFHVDALESPLLHLWSLAIEEQFYLFWPPAVFLLYRSRLRRWAPLLIMLALLISLALAQRWVWMGNGAGAFYMLRARGWELLLGAMLATGAVPLLHRRRDREAASVMGLAAIVCSMLLFNQDTPFPGLAAAAPCLGAAALIHANRAEVTIVGRWLSAPRMVLIGLISYPLYLWHWPLLVMPRLALGRALSPAEVGMYVILAFALAWVSWRLIERPLQRFRTGDKEGRFVLVAGVSILAVIATVATVIVVGQGFPQRASPTVLRAEAARNSINPMNEFCHVEAGVAPPSAAPCTTSGAGEARILLWGDSHAAHIMPGFVSAAGKYPVALRQLTKSSCPPLLPDRRSDVASADCVNFNRQVLGIAGDAPPETIVLAARWTEYLTSPSVEEAEQLGQEVRETIANIRQSVGAATEIVIVGPIPGFAFEPSKCHARTMFAGLDSLPCRSPQPNNSRRSVLVEQVLVDAASGTPGVKVALPWRNFCGSGGCTTVSEGVFLFRDANHLTVEGAEYLAPLLETIVVDSLPPDRRLTRDSPATHPGPPTRFRPSAPGRRRVPAP